VTRRTESSARVSGDDRSDASRNLASLLGVSKGFAQKRTYRVVTVVVEDDQGALSPLC
jgi:hypothetical protein